MNENLILILIFIGVAFLWLKRPRWSAPKTKPPEPSEFQYYQGVDSLFASRAELAFFRAMQAAIPEGFHVLTKVRLEDVIQVKKGLSDPKLRWRLRGRIKSRHIDFVIIDNAGIPRIAIEVDGPQHAHKDAQNADQFKNGVFESTEIPLYRIKIGENFHEFANSLARLLKSP